MEIYTLSDFKPIMKEQGYKYIALFDNAGKPIVNYNNTHIGPGDRLKEIETRLKAPSNPDGFYFIKCKNNLKKDTVTDDYCIKKGNPDPATATVPTIIVKETLSENGAYKMDFEEAIKLHTDNNRLELENARLTEELEGAQAALGEAEEEADEQPLAEAGLAQSNWAQTLAPVMNTYFEQEARRIKMAEIDQYHKYNGKAPAQVAENAAEPAQETAQRKEFTKEEQVQIAKELAELAENDPALYQETVAQMLNGE